MWKVYESGKLWIGSVCFKMSYAGNWDEFEFEFAFIFVKKCGTSARKNGAALASINFPRKSAKFQDIVIQVIASYTIQKPTQKF